jgi:N6-adenosine-specific RNA methylase IME4
VPEVIQGEVVDGLEYLEELAIRVRVEQRRGREALHEVRVEVQSQLSTGRTSVNFDKAVKRVRAALGSGRADRPDLSAIKLGTVPVPKSFPAIVVDPPWRYDNVATRGAAEDHYPTMSQAELAALEVPAASDAHLYLWVTNGFLREGFELLDAWGFAYKTVLTWCKPSIGMGNYFRNNTEHVLFAVKGRRPTQRRDVGTWFSAAKTRHSAKPESFYDLVESPDS